MRGPLLRRGLMVAVTGGMVAVGVLALAARSFHPSPHVLLADAANDALVLNGKQIYMRNCAVCHGRALQGQPLWQLTDSYAGRRAPAHDQSGHTWQHSDGDLFRMTKFGRWNSTLPRTAMPPFEGRLSDADTLAALAFIKRSWPLGLRVSQAMLNPGQAGMPAHAADLEWRLPPTTCRGSAIARRP